MTVISHFLSPYRVDSTIDRYMKIGQSSDAQESKHIEKLASAIGKKIDKALDRFESNQAHNAFLAEIRAYEKNRYKTNNQHCHECYKAQALLANPPAVQGNQPNPNRSFGLESCNISAIENNGFDWYNDPGFSYEASSSDDASYHTAKSRFNDLDNEKDKEFLNNFTRARRPTKAKSIDYSKERPIQGSGINYQTYYLTGRMGNYKI